MICTPCPNPFQRRSMTGPATTCRGHEYLPSRCPRRAAGMSISRRSAPRWRSSTATPRTGVPDREPPGGLEAWNALPGARGCTPEACAFRDHHGELRALGAEVFGLSTQTTEYQREAAERLRLPFELLSDAGFALTESLGLPTFEVEGFRLLKRLTLVIDEGRVAKVFYPVFPPDKHPEEVLRWLAQRR
jgi:peroxiredoxin